MQTIYFAGSSHGRGSTRDEMKIFYKIKYWLLIVYLSSRWMFRINLGDSVTYRGKVWVVSNGVCSPGFWSLVIKESHEYVEYADGKEVRKVWSLKNVIGSFRSGYRFYMTSWFDIWVKNGIEPWMRKCNIWAKEREG